MADTKGAYGTKNVEFRRKWDKDEYTAKAKEKDSEEKDRMKENEERLKQGALFPLALIHPFSR
jgi:U4/U6.U5 tri-snRNP component SNU23